MKQKTIPRKKYGAYLVYSWRKAQSMYLSPLQMLNEALALCHWKNIHAEDLDIFKATLNAKIKQIRQGKARRKYRGKHKQSDCYLAFKTWARKHGMEYSKEFYNQIWKPCYARGVEPEETRPARPISATPTDHEVGRERGEAWALEE